VNERARLFVAVWPPPRVLDAVAALARPEDPAVRYTTRDQWHVTLRFLGSCDLDEATAAFSAISARATVAELGPAVARLGRSVLVVPVGGLDAIAAAVIDATAAVGQPPEPRPFAGHLTIARLRRPPRTRIAGEPIADRFPVDEVHLVRSDLHPEGARYRTVATVALAAGW
jgi:2'-5' RNA ligase